MAQTPILVVGRAYRLSGMAAEMWTVAHPQYGKPWELAGKYLGYLQGERSWHGFEVWVGGKEVGVIFMPGEDLARLQVSECR